MSAFHQLVLPGLGGEEPLAQFGDRITLVVNVASQCGLTPQYAGLERLQQQYAARGFSVGCAMQSVRGAGARQRR